MCFVLKTFYIIWCVYNY